MSLEYLKFGFELEAFCTDANGEVCLVPPGIPKDGCGWLVEYRSYPFTSAHQAVGSLLGEQMRWATFLANKHPEVGVQLIPRMRVPRAVKLAARRAYAKGPIRHKNIYGLSPITGDTAGLHVSVTSPRTVRVEDGGEVVVNALFDFVQFFKHLDSIFKDDIKKAGRKPGEYEIKPDLRIEYRSLPNTVDLWKLADVITSY